MKKIARKNHAQARHCILRKHRNGRIQTIFFYHWYQRLIELEINSKVNFHAHKNMFCRLNSNHDSFRVRQNHFSRQNKSKSFVCTHKWFGRRMFWFHFRKWNVVKVSNENCFLNEWKEFIKVIYCPASDRILDIRKWKREERKKRCERKWIDSKNTKTIFKLMISNIRPGAYSVVFFYTLQSKRNE